MLARPCSFWRLLRKNPSLLLPVSGGSMSFLVYGSITPILGSIFHGCLIPVFSKSLSHCEHNIYRTLGHPNPVWAHLNLIAWWSIIQANILNLLWKSFWINCVLIIICLEYQVSSLKSTQGEDFKLKEEEKID